MSFESAVKKGREGNAIKKTTSSSSFDMAVEAGRSKNANYGVDDDYIRSYANYYTNNFSNAKNDFDSIGFDNAKSYADSYESKTNELNRMGDKINSYMRNNRNAIDDETYSKLYDLMNESRHSAMDITNAFKAQSDDYSRFSSKADYDAYIKAMERNKRLSEMDIEAEQKDIDRLQGISDSAAKYDNAYNAMLRSGLTREDADARAKEMTGLTTDSYGYATDAGYGSLSDLMNDLSQKKKDLYEAKNIQNRANLESVKNAPDFAEMSANGASVKNPSVREASGINLVGNVRLGATPVENIVTYTRDNKDYIDSELRKGRTNFVGDTKYNLMTDDEVSIYNYYIGRGDKESASAYLDSIYDELTRREAYGQYDSIKDNKALELAFSIVAGGDQVANAFKGMSAAMKGEDYVQASTDAYVGQMVRDDLNQNNKFLRFMYDTLSTTAAQVPAIALGGVLGAGVGAAALGLSAMGNTYAEKVNEGYDTRQALTYAAIDGATEVLMEKFLGAMPNIGGKAMDKIASSESVKRASSALKKILPKFAKDHADDFVKFFGSMASEFKEEALQEALAPIIENAVFGENTNETTMGEILYAGLLGAMSAGLMNGVGLATGYAGYKSAEADSYRAGQDYIMDYAKEAPEGSDARTIYDKVQQKIDDGGNASVKDLKNLDKANATARISKSGKTELNGKEVEISRVESVGKDGTKLRLKDGSVVDAKNLMYENEAKSVLYNSLASTKMSANALNYAINAYDGSVDPQKYVRGAYEAYTYGYSGVSEEHRNGSFYKELPQNIREALEQTARSEYEEIQKAKINRPVNDVVTGGKIIYDTNEKIDRKKLSTTQRVSLDLAVVLSKVLNVPIHVYESVLNDKGERVYSKTIEGTDAVAGNLAANGWHRTGTGEIYVDLNAGEHGEGTMVYTIAHELTHNMREMAGEAYNKLKTAIAEEFGASGGDLAKMVQRDIERNPQRYEGKSYDVAEEEFIARTMEGMLSDTNAVEQIERLRAKDGGLIDKIRAVIRKVINAMKAVYKQYKPESAEAQYILKEINNLDRIVNLYAEGVAEAANVRDGLNNNVNYKNNDTSAMYSFSSIGRSFFGDESISAKDFENKDYKKSEGYKNYVSQAVSIFMKTHRGISQADAKKEIEASIEGIVKVALASKKAGYDIFDDSEKRSVKDSKGRLLFSSLEPNSDYFTSSDISSICDKRLNFADIYDEIIKRETKKGVPASKSFFNNVDNYFYIHQVMAEKGLTTPCRQCYVESMRKNLEPMAKAFIELVNETDVNNKKNEQLYNTKGKDKGKIKENNAKLRERVLELLSEYGMSLSDITTDTLCTADGLAELKIKAPMLYEAFNSFYGQSKPKMPRQSTPFRFGELIALLTDDNGNIKTKLVDKINSTGGFRLQSYSDFQIKNYVDVLQVIFEAGVLGLNGHAYTKVPAFLDATNGTNLKRNISIFMYNNGHEWKLDRNDSFPATTMEDIYSIVNADKSGNTSIIAVSQNSDMSAFIMANDNIGYGIPFHKSGLKMATVRDTVVKENGEEIRGYSGIKDHTKQQTEVWAKTTPDHKAFTKVKNGINIYGEEVNWDFDNKDGLSKKELIEKNLKSYIDACCEAGYLPKFREYLIDNASVLNNVLKYSKELGFVSTDASIDDISFEYRGFKVPYGYYKFLGDFGMFTPDGEAAPHDALSLKNYDFDKAVGFFNDSEELRRNEILQQFANGEERQKYRESDLTAEELENIIRDKRNEVVNDILDDTMHSDRDVYDSIAEEVASLYSDIDWYDYSDNLTGDETAHLADQLRNGDYSVIDNIMDFYDDADDELQKKADKVIERINSLKTDAQMFSDRVLMGSMFSGGGTLEAGLVYQMLDKEFAVENNKKIASVYMDNHGKEHMFVGDVRDFDSTKKNNVFYLHASPVCKNFSNASNTQGETGLDITTAEATARVLEEQMPEVFTVENVKRYIGSEAYNIITSKLDDLGYTWDVDVYKASDYGNPTKRERMIIRAVKDGKLPQKPEKVAQKTSWYEATKDLFKTELKPSTLVKSKIEAIKNTPGISVSELLKSKEPVLIYDTTKSKKINFARSNELAPTLTTKCGDARITWNGKVYAPTPKFMGRLQGLPDNYKYPKADTTAFKIIGNGISTQLTKSVMGGVIESAYEQTHDGQAMYSDRDSKGNKLTDEQKEYFKNSKARDSEGNLKYLYHGTESAGFTVFDSNESDDGISFFFTDSKDTANSYSGSEIGVSFSGNEFGSIDKFNEFLDAMTVDQWGDERYHVFKDGSDYVLKVGEMALDEEGESILDEEDNYVYDFSEEVYRAGSLEEILDNLYSATNYTISPKANYGVYLNLENPLIVECNGNKWDELPSIEGNESWTTREYAEYAKDSGYDSVIFNNVIDNGANTSYNKESSVYVAFDSNQIKSAENTNPTDSNDIRYSYRVGSSNRTSLANALESVARTDLDRKILSEYKELAERLDTQEIELSRVRKEMTEARKNGDKVLLASLNQRKEFLQDAILRGDRKLTKLHATKPIRNMIEIEREKSYNEAIVNNKAFNKRVRDRHNDSLLRGKIKDTMHELNDYLLHGNKKKHIMIGLQKTVAEALKSIDLEHPNSGEKTLAKLEGLRNAYDKIMDSDDPMMQNVWDQNVSDVIKAVSEDVSDTPLYRMNTQQLNDVKYMFDMILHTIRNANRSFMTAKNENIYERVERAKSELDWNKQKLARIAGTGWLRKMAWGDLKPYYAFKFLGSETIQEAFENVRKGEETYANDVAETKEFFRDTAEKYNLYQYDMDERHEFKTDAGEKFSLNLSQMMSVYAYSKRPQAKAHLEVGGIVLNEDNTFKQKVGKINVKMENVNTKAYKLSEDTIKSITDAMDKNLKDYVDDMVRYLSFVMGNKGNEVSLAMYGVKQFTEDYYFPISSSDIYMAKVSDQKMLTEINPVLKNAGFTKDLVKNANNPITVKGFNETWAKHAVEMSNYHALTLPLEDLTRIINWNSKSKEGYDEGIVAKITNTHSREAVDYVKNFIRDVNGGARSDYYSGISNKLTSLFKKGATFASLSVTIQQPSAIGRAMALIEPKYFVGEKVDKMKHSEKWDLIKKYAPVAIIKEMGYFDTNMGRTAAEYILKREYQKGERAKAFIEDSGYRDDVFSVGASLADEYTWSAMWDACARKINAETDLNAGTEEFNEKVGDLFTQVIERTQVYDSVMSRSGLMRSKSDVVKMATSFMGEPTTSLNMLADAVMSAKEKDYASAKRKVGAVTASLILNSILVSFVYAARDDDKDKTYTEKYIKELVENTKDSFNVLNMMPYLRDIVSICQGYDVERTDMSVISDIVKSWQRLQSKSVSPYKKVENFAGSIAQAFGLPLKNIMRDVRGMYNVVTSPFRGNNIIADDITDAITSGITGKDEKKYDDWVEAVKTGKNIRTVLKRYETRGVEKSTLASQITSNFKQTYRNASNAERAAMKGYLLNAYELLGYDRAKKSKDIDKWLDD